MDENNGLADANHLVLELSVTDGCLLHVVSPRVKTSRRCLVEEFERVLERLDLLVRVHRGDHGAHVLRHRDRRWP
jgi:hypothetical protein